MGSKLFYTNERIATVYIFQCYYFLLAEHAVIQKTDGLINIYCKIDLISLISKL